MAEVDDDEGDDVLLRDTNRAKREDGLAAHLEAVEKILDAARVRDIEAEARDQASVARDHAADLEAFTCTDSGSGYGADLPARRHAALDRREAKGDRTSAADDRVALTKAAAALEVAHEDGGAAD